MKNLNRYHSIGLILTCLYLTLAHTEYIHHVIKGCIFGAGVGLTLVSIYAYNHDVTKIRNFKKKIIKKFLRIETK